MKILIKEGLILRLENGEQKLEKKDILIKDSKIEKIINYKETKSGFDKIINANDCMIIPGLINCHNHSYANLLKGIVENRPLELWVLDTIYGESNRNLREVYISTLLGCIQMIKTGTTTVLDHFTANDERLRMALKAYEDVGMRSAIAIKIADRHYYQTLAMGSKIYPSKLRREINFHPLPTVQELIDMCKNIIRDYNGKKDRLSIIIGPSGPQRCSRQLLEKAIELAEVEKLALHTHLLETKTQAVTAYEQYGKSMVSFLNEIGFLTERTSLAHCVWVSDKDIDILAHSKTSVVHNPISNLMLGSGIAPIFKILSSGINIGLGTDGANCGGNQILFEAMRFAAILHNMKHFDSRNWITDKQVFKMATSNGAKIFLKEDEVGEIKEGYKADLVLLDLNTPNLSPLNNPINLLVYSENGSSVRDVIINGQVILENKKILTINENEVLGEAKEFRKKIKNEEMVKFYECQKPYVEKIYKRATNKNIGFSRMI